MSSTRPFVLASASPRRSELFQLLDLPFRVQVEPVDESPRPGETPNLLVARLSGVKAAAVRQLLVQTESAVETSLIVAADTIVVSEEEILGKPRDREHAFTMLRGLRARSHTVHSGVAVVEAGSGRAHIGLNVTTVWMRDYSDAEIEDYVNSGDPFDKAGAYAIQNAAFHPVDRLEGCYTGVMGLPLGVLVEGLAHFGVHPAVDVASVCQDWTGQPCCQAKV